MTDSKRSWWSLRHTWAKGLGSSWSWAAKSQVQHEREAVSLSLLKLCSRTLTNKELLFFQIHGNPEQHAHVTSREENFFFQRHVRSSLIYLNISVSKFWTQPSLKPSSLPVTAGQNAGARLATLPGPGRLGHPGEIPAVLQPPLPALGSHAPEVQGHPRVTLEHWTVNLQTLIRNFRGSEGLQSKVLIAPSAL